MEDVALLTIEEASSRLSKGEITSLQLTQACLKNVYEKNSSLNAYLEVFADVEDQACAADVRRRTEKEEGIESHPLLGIPLAIKDNILIEGRRASAASKMLEHYTASYDATVIRKLKDAGIVFVGRTNMDEFAMGGSGENSAFGAAKNPHDISRVPGGSSSGSAAAVASGMALGALGTDTGGSIREPASFCGVVGLKPTYGSVSRSGAIAMGSSLDQIGPIARSVKDSQLIYETIFGNDPLDSTTVPDGFYTKRNPTKKIGVPRHILEGVDADVLELFNKALSKLEKQGYEVLDVELPSASMALAIYYIIMPAEVSTNLSRYDGIRYGLSVKGNTLFEDYAFTRAEGFGSEVRRRIILGTYVLSAGYYDAYYTKATNARECLRQEYLRALKNVDAVVLPTAPSPAMKLGEKSDPLSMYLLDIFTVSANLTGNPAISVPMGMVSREGKDLPVGIQFTTAHGCENMLFELGEQL